MVNGNHGYEEMRNLAKVLIMKKETAIDFSFIDIMWSSNGVIIRPKFGIDQRHYEADVNEFHVYTDVDEFKAFMLDWWAAHCPK